MRESAFKIVLLGGEPVRPDMVGAVTIAAREIADVHRPGDDGLCLPCLRRDCEPRRVAWVWLVATRDPMVRAMPRTVVDVLSPDLDEALLVLKQHEVYGCPQCTPGGCLVEESAMVARFDATVAGLPAGPATVDNLRRIAREIQGAPSEGDQGGGAPGSAG